MQRAAASRSVVVLAACAGAGAGTRAAPPPPDAPAVVESASTSASGAASGLIAEESPSTSSSAAAVPAASSVSPTPPSPLTIEPAYHAGAYPWPSDAAERKARIQELERWNGGGLGDGAKWHAAPRIVISEPVIAAGKLDVRGAMRKLRAEQYWTVRRCYEARLRDDPKLEGRTTLRLTVRADGTVSGARSIAGSKRVADTRKFGKTMRDQDVVRCLENGLRGAKVPPPRTKTATLLVSVDVYPGDALLPTATVGGRRGRVDLGDLRARLDAAEPTVVACFAAANERHPGIWGRLAMRLDVDVDGDVTDAGEVETTFPDVEATRCVEHALEALTLVAPGDGEARAVAAFRWGTPP